MATIPVNLNVTSNGTIEGETKKAKDLNAQLALAAANASKIGGGGSQTKSKISAASDSVLNRSLGSDAGTGSSTSDFAAQARGLGGLVHVYATFAANIYAVSAAFTALSHAANVSHIVQGLDQLGAASGKNLGFIAQKLVAVSDGTLSMKDALEATAKAASSGLSTDQFLKLAEVAKKAAQALGREMPDAMDRITRGAIKMEPRLLDELGILVKVGEANQNYARTLGKTASSLTDVEKHQGFANAVIEQGLAKFKDINVAANPYQKITASLANLTQTGLAFINTVLSPLVNLLASNPTALLGALAYGAVALTKQALPALAEYRKGLDSAVEKAADVAIKNRETYTNFHEGEINALRTANDKKLSLIEDNLKQTQLKSQQYAEKGIAGKGIVFKGITQFDSADLKQKHIDQMDKTIAQTRSLASAETTAGIAARERLEYQLKARDATLLRMQQQIVLTEAQTLADAEGAAVLNRKVKFGSEAWQLKQNDRSATSALNVSTIVKNAAGNHEVLGLSEAFKHLRGDIIESGNSLTMFGKVSAYTKGTLSILTGAIGTAFNAFQPWILAITILAPLFGALYDFMRSNSKEMEAVAKASEMATGAFENVGRTIDSINKKPILERLTPDTLRARATAIDEVATALSDVTTTLAKAEGAAKGFDRFVDDIKRLFGGGLKATASKGMSQLLSASLDAGFTGESKDKFKKSLAELLNTSDLSAKGIERAVDGLSIDEVIAKFAKLTTAQKAYSEETKRSSNDSKQFELSLEGTAKAASETIISLMPSDNLAKLGSSMMQTSQDLSKVLKDGPIASLAEMNKLLNDSAKLSLLPPDAVSQLLGFKTQVDSINKAIQDADGAITKYNETIASNKKFVSNLNHDMGDRRTSASLNESVSAENKDLEKRKVEQEKFKVSAINEIASLMEGFSSANDKIFAAGAKYFSDAISSSGAQAALTIAKAGSFTGTGAAEEQYKLKVAEIEIAKTKLLSETNLLKAQIENSAAIDRSSAQAAKLTSQLQLTNANKGLADALASKDPKKADLVNTATKSVEEANTAVKLAEQSSKVAEYSFKHRNDTAATLYLNIANLKVEKASAKTAEERAVIDSQIQTSLKNYGMLSAAQSKLVTENAKIEAAAIEKKVAQLNETLAIEQKRITNAQELVSLGAKDLESLNKFKYISDVQYINDKSSLDLEQQSLALSSKVASNETRIAELKLKQSLGHKDELALAEAIAEQSRLQTISSTQSSQIELDRKRTLDEYYAAQQLSLNIAQINGQVGVGDLANEIGALEVLKLQVAEQDRLNQKKREAIDTTFKEAVNVEGPNGLKAGADKAAATDELDKQIEKQGVLAAIEDKRSTYIAAMSEHAKSFTFEMDKLNRVMSKTDSIANSLGKVFKNFGSGLGGVIKSLAKNASDQKNIDEKLFQDKRKLQEKYGKDTANYKAAANAADINANQDKMQNELDTSASIADAASKMFGEKTAAAQAFGVVSTVLHVASLAMQAEAAAADIVSLASKLASNTVRIVSNIATAASEMFAQGGWVGFAGVAAMLVVMASLGAKSGGSSASFTQSSEEKQKTQGTGQKFDPETGKLVDTGSGVLGDSTAKSESIKKSLEILAQYTFEELDYSNQMVTFLKSIDNHMSSLASQLAKTLGINTGTGFGTKEGVGRNPLDTGSKLVNTFLAVTPTAKKLLSATFGGPKTTKIVGSGINIQGSLGELASGKGNSNQYETVNTTAKGGLFKKDTNITTPNYKALDKDAQDSIAGIFKGVFESLKTVGSELGLNAETFTKTLTDFKIAIPIETRNLTGKALEDAINASISSAIDGITSSTLSILKPFQKIGEGLFETAVRVTNDSKVIDLQLRSVGISFKGIGIDSITAKENLIKLAGGLNEFVAQSEYFKQHFLTDVQRLAPVQKALATEMERLQISSITTKEGFANLVLAQDLSTETGQKTYQSLMNISKAFITVYGSAEDTAKVLVDKSDMEFEILKKLSTAERGVTLDRRKELAALNATLRPLREYMFALEDEAAAKEALTVAYKTQADELQNTIDKLDSSSNSLKDFRNSLLLSSQSTLTPRQKYAESQKQFDTILSLASAPAATKDEIAAKDRALGQLQGAATAFLTASAIYNASSPQYTADFNKVTSSIGATAAALSAQKTDAEKQLDELKSSVSGLININTSVLSVKDAIIALTQAISTSQKLGAASGSTSYTPGSTTGGASSSRSQAIAGLYSSVLGRTPDTSGMQYWEQDPSTINQMRKSFYLSREFISGLSGVEDAYTKILHRAPDAAGLEFYKQSLTTGQNLGSVVDSMLRSSEYAGLYPGLAKGGIGKGTTWVGENGPELVNFDSPGRVFSNSQSQGMMEAFVQPLLSEMKTLKATIEALKEANRQDAGNIIASNYDANQRNADAIATVVSETGSKTNWANKQQVLPM